MREAGTVSAEQEAEWRGSYEWSRSEQEPRPAMPAHPFFVGDYWYQGPTAANRGQNTGALETSSHDLQAASDESNEEETTFDGPALCAYFSDEEEADNEADSQLSDTKSDQWDF